MSTPAPDPIHARIAMAEQDLAQAEATDLATASNARLVALVESLRSSLTDTIRIARHLASE